jgi:superfamily II DNA/RNA helicase
VIQQHALPLVMDGRDVIAQAHPRAGKTTALAISVLQSIDTARWETQAFVLCPTQEAAANIQSVVVALGRNMGVQCYTYIRSTPTSEDLLWLATDRSQHIVIGTPDCVLDLLRGGILKFRTNKVKILALEDADGLVENGYQNQILTVRQILPTGTRTVATSTTLSHNILNITTKLMTNPTRITAEWDIYAPMPKDIKHFFARTEWGQWPNIIPQLFKALKIWRAVVFCSSLSQASSLSHLKSVGLILCHRLIASKVIWEGVSVS